VRVLVAGATGALGKRLVPLLLKNGYDVSGTTRLAEKAEALRRDGVHPVIVDAFDADALRERLIEVKPEVVFHMLTDLPYGTKPEDMVEGGKRNARMRREGTPNLVAAALAGGARKMIAESIAWTYASGPEPHAERDPLDVDAAEPRQSSVRAVAALEHAVLNSPPLAGVVLRFGELYGPGTGHGATGSLPPVHVDAAVHAALLAIDRAETGIFNVVEDNAQVSNAAARSQLGWSPDSRIA